MGSGYAVGVGGSRREADSVVLDSEQSGLSLWILDGERRRRVYRTR